MIPDYCEAITGYRCWAAYPNGLLLGLAHRAPWPPYQPMTARCTSVVNADAHLCEDALVPAPVLECDCGVYAFKRLAAAGALILDERRNPTPVIVGELLPPEGRVWGAVKLWGRVIEHALGYRAECAYPSALWCDDETLASTVAALYGVPCALKTLPIGIGGRIQWGVLSGVLRSVPRPTAGTPIAKRKGLLNLASW